MRFNFHFNFYRYKSLICIRKTFYNRRKKSDKVDILQSFIRGAPNRGMKNCVLKEYKINNCKVKEQLIGEFKMFSHAGHHFNFSKFPDF